MKLSIWLVCFRYLVKDCATSLFICFHCQIKRSFRYEEITAQILAGIMCRYIVKVDIIPRNYLLPARSTIDSLSERLCQRTHTPDVRSLHITLHTAKNITHF